MARIAVLALLQVYGVACSGTCSSNGDSSASCDPRASRSLLQQEKAKLQSVGLETARMALDAGETAPDKNDGTAKRHGASTKLLYRVFDNPKGARLGVDVSLLETAFAKHKGALQHKDAKALLKSIAKGRIEPKGMQKHVEEELLPMAESTANELQEEINKAMESVKNCSTLMWSAETALSHREKILNTDQQKEYECLIAENEANHAMKDACDRVDKMMKAISESEPVKIKNLPNKSASNVLPAMKANVEFYTKTHADFESASAACKGATEASKGKHSECEVDKEVVEKFYCYMKEGRDTACADYAKCFEDGIQNYRTVKGHVEKTEVINKEHFTQMACSVWVTDVHPACDMETTAHLDVSYPEEPLQSTCMPMMKFHGRGDHTKFQCEDGKPEVAGTSPEVEAPLPRARLAPVLGDGNETEAVNTSEVLPEETEAPIASAI